jgi:ketosteroid isomerase-like protein
MTRSSDTGPAAVIERLGDAMNGRDLEAMVACFAPEYLSEQPLHPARTFQGQEQVRRNWAQVFGDVPDFRADLVRTAVVGETVWTEWRWQGTRRDGSRFEMRGVTLLGVQAGLITWGRLYMEPVEQGGHAIDEAVRRITSGSSSGG